MPDPVSDKAPLDQAAVAVFSGFLKAAKAAEVQFPELQCKLVTVDWVVAVRFQGATTEVDTDDPDSKGVTAHAEFVRTEQPKL